MDGLKISSHRIEFTDASRSLNHAYPQEDITLHIPVSVRRYILGTGGKTLKAITNNTGTRIRLPPRQEDHGDGRNELDVEEDEELMDVRIEGDIEGVSMAKDEILKITKERARKHELCL